MNEDNNSEIKSNWTLILFSPLDSDYNFPEEPCQPNPCQNGGSCQEHSEGGFSCICPDRCQGSQCQICQKGKNYKPFIQSHISLWHKIHFFDHFIFAARFEITDGFPTLMFINPKTDESLNGSLEIITHRGRRDLDTLMTFIGQQMGRTPTKSQVRLQDYTKDLWRYITIISFDKM